MKIILTGGGTGGHIYPALAIAQGLKERLANCDILYVGSNAMESEIVPKAGLPFTAIDVSGINRSSMLKASKSLVKFPHSFFQAREVVKKFSPDIVVGTGGYVSFPVVLAGTFYAQKTFIHEQNAWPGLANRNLARRVDCTMLTFEEAREKLNARKIIVTGLPVRKEIKRADKAKARKKAGLNPDMFTLVAFGGSRGAARINEAMLSFFKLRPTEPTQIIWITGEDNFEEINRIYQEIKYECDRNLVQIYPFRYDMENVLATADIVLCRAGASTLAELAMMGLPAILVPYPYAADNHQEKNARAMVKKNAAEMVIDEFLDGDTLLKMLNKLRADKGGLIKMGDNMFNERKPNALNDILDIILS